MLGVTGALIDDSDTAVEFDSGQKATAASSSAFSVTEGTIELWALSSSATSQGLTRRIDGDGHVQFELSFDADRHVVLKVGYDTNCTAATVTSSLTYSDGSYHHIVGTFTSDVGTLYIDGESVGTASTGATPCSVDAPFEISDGTLIGDEDEVAFYGTALSASRVLAHYRAGLHQSAP